MQNEGGEIVDTYIPRKCDKIVTCSEWFCPASVTNRIISAKDHASVQINVGELDENGRYTNNFKTYAFSGFLRNTGDSDEALIRMCMKDGMVSQNITE